MKTGASRLSVGLVGLLREEGPRGQAELDNPPSSVGFPPNPVKSDHKLDHPLPRVVAPDSRNPLVKPEIRANIEAIEADARAKGWPAELLWNVAFWDRPRGLAAVLEAEDQIGGITPDYIEILKRRHDLLRFRRFAG
jgi:hypothetical protein